MATVRSVKEYQRLMKKRSNMLRKQNIKTASKTATFMQATAIKLAPRYTGQTIRGIKKKKTGKGANYAVESFVPGTFKQNLWANQTAPFRTIRPFWNQRRPTVYGDGTHFSSGTPRFFHFATLRARKKFQKLGRQNTRKALKVSL